ncbi:hypothetical protein C8R46DRAFT_1218805 [Mycena filopes]|nr:hypothetical protein C8R46DRAFT_1218805 [Mycena filopes]
MQCHISAIIALAFGALVAQAIPVQRPEDVAVRMPETTDAEVEDRGCKLYSCF